MKLTCWTWIKVTESSSFKELVPFLSLYCGIWKHPLRFRSLSLLHPKKSHLHASSLLKVPIPVQFSSEQSLSRVRLFATPCIIARQASLSVTNSQSLLKLVSIESLMPSNHLILFYPCLLLPSTFSNTRVFSSELVLRNRWPKHWNLSFTISPSNEYSGWFPLGWTGWISLQSKGLWRVFSNTTVQKHQFFSAQLSL